MKKVTAGGFAVAEAVKNCHPYVMAMYPITPSTYIPEKLSEYVANGELKSEIILVESEHSAISACLGVLAAGSRAFTATSSQGLALMHEVVFAAAGMRLPLVMGIVNRALSAPLNIWNDYQDSISERDSGWIQLYVENNQEAVDTMIQAYKIAEDKNVLLPVMVCMDGFYLSHTYENVDIPNENETKSFLPDYKAEHAYLDPAKPITQGTWASPEHYQTIREELSKAVDGSIDVIKKVHDDYGAVFGRKYGNGLVEKYKNSSVVFVSMGSLCGNLKEVADKKDFEVLRVRCFRPFPHEEIVKELKDKETIIIVEKDISLGLSSGTLFSEIRDALYGESNAKIVGFIAGLGGKDVRLKDVEKMLADASEMKNGEVKWV